MNFVGMTKLAEENKALKAELAQLKEENASFKKQAEAEALLLELSEDRSTPHGFVPVTPKDFIEKRAELTQLPDMQSARVAVKLASRSSGFEIGSPDPVSKSEIAAKAGENKSDRVFDDLLRL